MLVSPKSRPKAAKEGLGPDKNMLAPSAMVLYALFYERYSKKLRPFVFAFFFVFFFVYQAFLLSNENNLPITPFFIHFFTQTSAQAPSRF